MKRRDIQRVSALFIGAVLLGFTCLLGCESKPAAPEASAPADPAPENAPEAAPIPADQTMSGPTKNGEFYLVATPSPNPIPFQKLFEIEVQIYTDADMKTPAEQAVLDQVRVMMPAHRHGMKTEPEIEALGAGKFRVKGLKFHMQGEGSDGHWTLEYVVRDGQTIDAALFDRQCCRE